MIYNYYFNCNPPIALFLHFENQVVFAFFTCNCWRKTFNVDWWLIMLEVAFVLVILYLKD